MSSEPYFTPMHDARPVRRYQVWRGNNTFCFGGRVVTGSSPGVFVLTNLLTLPPFIVFSILV